MVATSLSCDVQMHCSQSNSFTRRADDTKKSIGRERSHTPKAFRIQIIRDLERERKRERERKKEKDRETERQERRGKG